MIGRRMFNFYVNGSFCVCGMDGLRFSFYYVNWSFRDGYRIVVRVFFVLLIKNFLCGVFFFLNV